jgi:hypothetical protein
VLCHNESSFPDLMAYMVTMLDHTDCAAAADIYRFFPFARGCFASIDFDMVQRGNRRATEALMLKNVERLRRGDRVIWGSEWSSYGGLTSNVYPFVAGVDVIG